MRLLIAIFLLSTFGSFAQINSFVDSEKPEYIAMPVHMKMVELGNIRMIPIESYFRDRILTLAPNIIPVFPVMDRETGYYERVANPIKRYSNFGFYLYNRELIEIKDGSSRLWITPLLDVSYGKDLTSDSLTRISQNTRGVRIEGVLRKRVSFTTSFFENQAILPSYAREYALSRGEFYPDQNTGTYYQTNAVISGAARTKPFAGNGFDYAYAVGSVNVRLTSGMDISWGNTSLFVGSGYRSMLWSDHSLGGMNLRFRWKLSRKFDFQIVRMRGINMLRRIGGVNGEAFYEPTSLSMATLYYHPTKNSTIGLFEGGVWNRGDSINKTNVSPLYFIPLPGASVLGESSGKQSNTVLGLDGNLKMSNVVFYGQIAMNPFVANSSAFQVGTRVFSYKSKGAFIQLEYNQADRKAYTSSNPRMNYASYNLPLAHPAGTNFQEFLVRGNYEYKDFFLAPAIHFYPKQLEQASLLPVYLNENNSSKKVILTLIECGYKFNRAYGLEVFGQIRYRKSEGSATTESSWISAGIRTAIRNHYFDY